MALPEYTLDDLAQAAEVEPRTIRHYVTEGLLPRPLKRGRGATYPHDALDRARAIRRLIREAGLGLEQIRHVLDRLDPAMLARVADGSEPLEVVPIGLPSPAGRPAQAERHRGALEMLAGDDAGRVSLSRLADSLDWLARRAAGRQPPARPRQTEHWVRVPISRDLEISMRGPASQADEQHLEQIAASLAQLMRPGARVSADDRPD